MTGALGDGAGSERQGRVVLEQGAEGCEVAECGEHGASGFAGRCAGWGAKLGHEGLELFERVLGVVSFEVIVDGVEGAEAVGLSPEDFGAVAVGVGFGSGLKYLGAHARDDGAGPVLGFSAVRCAEAAVQFGSVQEGLGIGWDSDADMEDAGSCASNIHFGRSPWLRSRR